MSMSDLISRAEAIDAVHKEFDGCLVWDESGQRTADEVENILDGLPSVQPERLTDDDFETIRIHLSACKERLCNQQRWEEAEKYQRILDRFMAFASSQQKPLKYSGDSICIYCMTSDCDGCMYEPMEGVING